MHDHIATQLIKVRVSILDCSCGISTQLIGLANLGHEVVGIDLSSAAIQRAKAEAASFDVQVDFHTGDFRYLEQCISRKFDVVLSCDNVLPHLLIGVYPKLMRPTVGIY